MDPKNIFEDFQRLIALAAKQELTHDILHCWLAFSAWEYDQKESHIKEKNLQAHWNELQDHLDVLDDANERRRVQNRPLIAKKLEDLAKRPVRTVDQPFFDLVHRFVEEHIQENRALPWLGE